MSNDDRYSRLPETPSSVYTESRHADTSFRRFREYFEQLFMDAAMEEMREKFPDEVGLRARKKERGPYESFFHRVLVTVFHWTPNFIKRPITRRMFIYSVQNWPDSVPMGPGQR